MSSVDENLTGENSKEVNVIDEANNSNLKNIEANINEDKSAVNEIDDKLQNKTKSNDGVSSWLSVGTDWLTGGDSLLSADVSENAKKVWGVNWLQSAKEKTLETIEFMKKDLNEFSDTLQQEVSTITAVATNSVKKPAKFFQQQFNQFSHNLIPNENITNSINKNEFDEKSNEKEISTPTSNNSLNTTEIFGASKWFKSIVETIQKFGIEDTTKNESNYTEELQVGTLRKSNLEQFQLLQIQNDEQTYLCAPSQSIDLYREWLLEFKITEYNGEINMLLSNNPKLREIYSRLVPSNVDNHTFWNRYFFKIYLLELDKKISESKEKLLEENSNEFVEKDETWSLCSSGTNLLNEETITILNELKTQTLEASIKENDVEDEWVKFNDEENNITQKK